MSCGYGHYSPSVLQFSQLVPGSDRDLFISVVDTDGEFLLIEAANALPSWAQPEIMDNRVWINSGELLLAAEKDVKTTITLKQGLEIIQSGDKGKVQRLRLVEEEAFYRVSKYGNCYSIGDMIMLSNLTYRYPEAARDQLHYAWAKVPRRVALVLHERPQYISASVEQFYLRDPISLKVTNLIGVLFDQYADLMKACKSMRIFNPKDSVTVSIKFTKVLYAQLRSQEFDPPAGAGFSIPQVGNSTQSKDFAIADIGMKVACGFEMLVAPEGIKTVCSCGYMH